MARVIDDPGTDPGTGGPGDPGYTPPTSGTDTKFAAVTTNSNFTLPEEDIVAAGGPWPAFRIRVTPVNDWGVGAYQEVEYPTPP